jgi:cation:H+ antiporter
MLLACLAILAGLVLMIWSADRFVEGSAATAHHYDVPPLIVGMVIVGFGTSAPEMVVSVMAASQGNPALALGNAWGSNIGNIGLILGLTALLYPVLVQSVVLRKELPILLAVTVLAGAVMLDNDLSRWDAAILLGAFAALTGWTIYQGMRGSPDALADETAHELDVHAMPLRTALLWLAVGLILLIVSSRLLVWGAVSVAQTLGVSDLVIGLTIVAVGTSLPELASCIAAAKKGEHDIALGNILGSNLFNTMAVVGLAGMVAPTATDPALLWRDWPVMAGLTVLMFVMAMGWRGRQGQINRWEGGLLILAYIAYVAWLLQSVRTTA